MAQTQIEIVSKSLDTIAKKLIEPEGNQMLKVLIPLLIGSALTFLTQYLLEYRKVNAENISKKRILKSKAQAKVFLIAQIVKDLCMFKIQKQYYIRAYQIATDEKSKDDCFKKHYDKSTAQRETECKLDENIAHFLEIITEYSIISNNQNLFENEFDFIFNYQHPKAEKFENCNSTSELVQEHLAVEKKLNSAYENFVKKFIHIQKSM